MIIVIINTIKCKAVKSKKHNWITKEQVILILDQTTPNKTGIRDRFIMFFMFSTGARLSEMLDIKLKDIVMDTQYPYLILTGKGNKTRVIPITVEFLDNLKYYLKLYHPVTNNDDYLLTGRYVSIIEFYKIVNSVLNKRKTTIKIPLFLVYPFIPFVPYLSKFVIKTINQNPNFDNSKFKQLLNKDITDFKETIKNTTEFFKNN